MIEIGLNNWFEIGLNNRNNRELYIAYIIIILLSYDRNNSCSKGFVSNAQQNRSPCEVQKIQVISPISA